MGVIEQVGLAADDPVGCPLIGYDNLVTASNITASTSAAGFPATNLANPATHLKWKATTNNVITLLHFDGSDGSTSISDSAGVPHTWTVAGGGPAQLDTAQQKFGASSVLFSSGNSPDDYIFGDGSAAFAFGAEDFTIEFWVRFNTVAAQANLVDFRPEGVNGLYPVIFHPAAGGFSYNTNSLTQITGTTVVVANTWYHVALSRSSGLTKLFVNGIQEGATYVDTNIYIVGTDRPTIGSSGTAAGLVGLDGWIDELRMLSFAAYTDNFTPATGAFSLTSPQYITIAANTNSAISYIGVAGHNWNTAGTLSIELNDGSGYVEVISTIIANTDPIIFRLIPHSANSPALSSVRIKFDVNDLLIPGPEAAVIYVGELLVLERSIDIGSGHVPITYGRRSNIINGMSETGNFLGRIVLGEFRQSKAEFKWFTDTFYRSDIDAFLAAAQEAPFFWAWSPEEYPLEVGYVWLTNDAEPEVDPVTRRISLELEMRGIA